VKKKSLAFERYQLDNIVQVVRKMVIQVFEIVLIQTEQ